MPLSDHEQQILDEIERRLAEDDPKLVEQVARTDLYTHLTRRIRLAGLAFIAGALAAAAVRRIALDRGGGVRRDGRVGADDRALPRPARARPDPRDAGRWATLDQRDHGPDRRPTAAAGAALDPTDDGAHDGFRRLARSGGFAAVVTSRLATCSTAAVQRAPLPLWGCVTVERRLTLSIRSRAWTGRWCEERRKGARPYGGIHHSSSLQVHRMYAPPAPLLGSDRPGAAHGPGDRRPARRPTALRLPRPRGAPRREVAPGRRDVAAAGPALVGLPEQEGRPRSAPVRGQARHRRADRSSRSAVATAR